jgi:hypothetical protein
MDAPGKISNEGDEGSKTACHQSIIPVMASEKNFLVNSFLLRP